jgi:hypothetical protein
MPFAIFLHYRCKLVFHTQRQQAYDRIPGVD